MQLVVIAAAQWFLYYDVVYEFFLLSTNSSLRSVSLLIMQAAMGFKKTKITLQR